MNHRKIVACAALVVLLAPPCAAESEWRPVSNQQGVQVSNRAVEGFAIKEFRGETIVPAPVEVAYEVLDDSRRFSDWFGDCRRQETTCRIDKYSKIIHHVIRVPVLKDRDVIAKVEFQPGFRDGTLVARVSAVTKNDIPADCRDNAWIPDSSNHVRITTLTCTFELRQLDRNSSRVTYTVLVDPGGHIPAWVANYFAKNNPVSTLSRFKDVLKEPAYWRQASYRHHKQFEAPDGVF